MNNHWTTINNTQLTGLSVSAAVIAIQLPAATQHSDCVDCAAVHAKCISTSLISDVQHIDWEFKFYTIFKYSELTKFKTFGY